MSLLNAEGLRSQALEEIETRLSGPLANLALWYKAKFQIQDEDWTNSLANLRRVFAMAKEGNDRQNLPGILIDCGDVLRRIGDYKIAKLSYDCAYKMEPMRQDVVLGKAICDCEIADFDGARASLEKVLDPTSDDASFAYPWNLHGWSLQHLGDAAGAMKSYRKALELNGQEDPWYRKGVANMMLNFDPEAAKENFKAILNELSYSMESRPPREQPSGDTSTVRLMGWCNYRLGHYVEAFRLIESVVDRSPDPLSAQFDLGLLYLASGRLRLAKEAYVRGYELARRCQVLQQRGIFYIALFDLGMAGSTESSVPIQTTSSQP
jgi:tetratricopeptide (TPR) repeat protein